jgi:hypothetical protein
MSERQTVAGAYQKIESHEDLCAVRYGNIHSSIEDLKGAMTGTKKTIDKIVWLALTTLIGVAGWLGAQLFNATVNQPADPPAAASE